VTAAGCLLAAGASGASASVLATPQAVERECSAMGLGSGAGVDTATWTAPADGMLTAELAGDARSDWDLALFRGGRAIAASTSFTSI